MKIKLRLGQIFSNNLLEKYIFKELIKSVLLVFLLILAIYNFIAFFNQIDKYDFFQAISITLLASFDAIYDMSKPVMLIGIMVGISALSANSELIAIRVAGITTLQIIKVVIQVSLVFSFVVYFCAEIINPIAYQIIDDIRQTKVIKQTQSGLWLKNDNGIVRIKKNVKDKLMDVYTYKIDDNKLSEIKKIKTAEIANDSWNLKNIHTQDFIYQNNDLSEIKKSTGNEIKPLSWLNQDIFNQIEITLYKIGIAEVWKKISFLKETGVNHNIYLQNLYKRIFTVVDLIFIAVFALFLILYIPIRSHKTSSRILLGLVMGLSIHLVAQILDQSFLIYNLYPIFSNLTMVLIFIISISLAFFSGRKNH